MEYHTIIIMPRMYNLSELNIFTQKKFIFRTYCNHSSIVIHCND